MTLQLHIERHEFFRTPDGRHLRYTSHWPEGTCGAPVFECGCTKTAAERPKGDPEDVQTIVEYRGTIDGMRVVYSSWFGGLSLYPGGAETSRENHMYAWVDGNRVQVEVGVGWEPRITDREWLDQLLLSHVYVGPPAPKHLATMYNGHSPTRLDLSEIGPNSVWMHRCNWGHERMEKLSYSHSDTMVWVNFVSAMQRVQAGLPGLDDRRPLAEVVAGIPSELRETVEVQAGLFVTFFRHIQESKTWEVGKKLMRRADETPGATA